MSQIVVVSSKAEKSKVTMGGGTGPSQIVVNSPKSAVTLGGGTGPAVIITQ